MPDSDPPRAAPGPYREGPAPPEPPAEPTASGRYPQLARLAHAYGATQTEDLAIRFERDKRAITVSLEIDSGTVTGLAVRVARGGLPEVLLRREDDVDRRGKERGHNVEAQTGDSVFDAAVYIETDAPHGTVRLVLAAERARTAVQTLLGWCARVALSPDGIHVAIAGDAMFDPRAFRPLLDALLELAGALPAHVPAAPEVDRRGAWLLPTAFTLLPFTLLCQIFGFAACTPEGFALPLLGAVAGLAAWIPLRPVLARATRGHSRGYRHYVVANAVALLLLPCAGSALAVTGNALLDPSPEDHRAGRVVSVRRYVSDDEPHAEARVAWADGRVTSEDFSDERDRLAVGGRVTAVHRRGLFGFAWVQRGPTLE